MGAIALCSRDTSWLRFTLPLGVTTGPTALRKVLAPYVILLMIRNSLDIIPTLSVSWTVLMNANGMVLDVSMEKINAFVSFRLRILNNLVLFQVKLRSLVNCVSLHLKKVP